MHALKMTVAVLIAVLVPVVLSGWIPETTLWGIAAMNALYVGATAPLMVLAAGFTWRQYILFGVGMIVVTTVLHARPWMGSLALATIVVVIHMERIRRRHTVL
jgi:hypothetical protein